jgi:hypothetical protein
MILGARKRNWPPPRVFFGKSAEGYEDKQVVHSETAKEQTGRMREKVLSGLLSGEQGAHGASSGAFKEALLRRFTGEVNI